MPMDFSQHRWLTCNVGLCNEHLRARGVQRGNYKSRTLPTIHYCTDNKKFGTIPAILSLFLVLEPTLTNMSRNTVRALPASQPPFLIRYSRVILFAQIDSAYVVFPQMEKKKSAGDSPSHRVLKFFTAIPVSHCSRHPKQHSAHIFEGSWPRATVYQITSRHKRKMLHIRTAPRSTIPGFGLPTTKVLLRIKSLAANRIPSAPLSQTTRLCRRQQQSPMPGHTSGATP